MITMDNQKSFVWYLLGAMLFALFIFGLNRLNQPEKIVIEKDQRSVSSEHEFVHQALHDVEAIEDSEDYFVRSSTRAPKSPRELAQLDSDRGEDAVSLIVGFTESLPSDGLKRAIESSGSLSEDVFTQHQSEVNIDVISKLRSR